MHTKRITFSTTMKIGIELEQCKEIGTFLLLECSPVRTNMFENTDLYRTKPVSKVLSPRL